MATGKISVQTENIFPIIKKFLYSDHEIFLRELVSNAVDASQKIKMLTNVGENKTELGNLEITIAVDKEAKTITIADKGLGMTAEEVEKYINQVAFSGAEEFLEKFKNQTEANPIIGHFGLGFYSAFMVADKVEFTTKSYKHAPAVKWSCDGSTDYTLEETTHEERGTTITLFINEENAEFLETARIETLLEKYCRFLPIPVMFDNKQVNNPTPAWTKKPVDLNEEDYKNFYKELYPIAEDPLFHIHLNVDYPFNLTGILYFPRHKRNNDLMQKNKVQLYCNQVFVTDNVEGIVPEFLTLLHGVIDSPDIPLNVSRSYLQSDGNVKKISTHITKKVADKLDEIFSEKRSEFEEKWDELGLFIKYGILTDDKFFDRAKNFTLLKSSTGKYYTLEEYNTLVKLNQEDKDKKIVYLYTHDAIAHHALLKTAADKGYDVLLMDGQLDMHFIQTLETKLENVHFARIDSDVIDNLIKKGDKAGSNLNADQEKMLKELTEKIVEKEKYQVQIESLGAGDAPVYITQSEFMRRMKDMSKMGGGYDWMGVMPENYNLVLNGNHPLISKILVDADAAHQEQVMKHAIDLAMLENGLLKGEALTAFVQRNINLLQGA